MAGFVGGVVMFLWGAVSHMVLPIGDAGIRMLSNEDTVMATLRQSVPEAGVYLFPGMDMRTHPTPEQQKAWEAKYQAGPIGLLVYHPTGEKALSPRQLGTELASNIAAALVVAWILSFCAATFFKRALIVAALGLFAWLSIDVSYWNWYGFSQSFVTAEAIDQVVGWSLSGLAIAGIVRRID